ncbi:MAG: extracellular solute-binding protein [Verrucomicrobiota bacterium]
MKHLSLLVSFLLTANLLAAGEVRLYTQRHYSADQAVLKRFTDETGIEVKVVKAGANELIERIKAEQQAPQADLFWTVDAGTLDRAAEAGLFAPVESETLSSRIPEGLASEEGLWWPVTMRARVFAVAKDRVENAPQTYLDLANPEWKGRLLIRSSSSAYNQSLLAALIDAHGKPEAQTWAEKTAGNLARPPQGGDRDQIRAVALGLGDIALTNTYYLGLLETSDDPADRKARAAVEVVLPDLKGRGTHVNVSGAGVVKGAANTAEAIQLLEFLTSPEIQSLYQTLTSEYAVTQGVEREPLQTVWGELLPDTTSLHKLVDYQEEAVRLFDMAGWP